jgi:hypothetical protein
MTKSKVNLLAAMAWLCSLAPLPLRAQGNPIVVPAGTPLPVKIDEHMPMKTGERLRTELLYPVYVDDRLVLPAHTIITGKVMALTADRTRRIHARLRADFTPFHIPVVQFDHVELADGTSVPLTTGTATDGAPIYRLVAPPPRKGGLVSKGFAAVKQGVKDRVAVITGPEKGDRFLQFVYSQLPYHPERIAKGTAWTVETAAPFDLPAAASLAAAAPPAPEATEPPRTWLLEADLNTPMSSANSRPGQTIQATVAEPVLNADGSVAVPVGSVMSGSITTAKAARSFGRAGTLRFRFSNLKLPGQEAVAVQASIKGADSASDSNMEMNSEGEVKPKPQDKIVVPLLLVLLAARPLDRDGGRNHDQFGKDAVASNSLGTIGFIVGVAAQQANLAAGIGYYGAAISIYERIFRRGKEVAYTRDTRVVIQTTARRSAALKPDPER